MNCPAALVVPVGTGAPVKKNRGPMTVPAVIAPPGLSNGLVPVKAV